MSTYTFRFMHYTLRKLPPDAQDGSKTLKTGGGFLRVLIASSVNGAEQAGTQCEV